MIIRYITAVGVSSFFLGVWLDRKYREFKTILKIPGFQIFDAVNADSIVNNNQQLIINHEERISQVRCTYILSLVDIFASLYLTYIYLHLPTYKYFLDNEIWISKFR